MIIRLIFLLIPPLLARAVAQDHPLVIDLNGTWDFEQTRTAAPPEQFTRRISVPGLAFLAEPRIEQYDHYFAAVREDGRSPVPKRSAYEPRYHWYRRTVIVPREYSGREAFLTVAKSQYVTQAFVNGIDVGYSAACATPLDFWVTSALRFGEPNEILVRVGDRAWLPSSSPGGVDNEKDFYAAGIWDDVALTFTGKFRLHRVLVLPSLKAKSVLVKLQVQCNAPARQGYGVALEERFHLDVVLKEKNTGRKVGAGAADLQMRGGKIAPFELNLLVESPRAWSPDDPFLYVAEIQVREGDTVSDALTRPFGMRDFTRAGKYFALNGEKILLRGSNIGLHRFFNDPSCRALPWDRAWVRRLLGELPRELHWNIMRNHVGLLPDFWYDIADEVGLLLQNEWFYWQAHGGDEQARAEFTDWVWADGSHPSIAIWDAMNEHHDNFIGNVLIPELMQLDPTRVWDNGYMTRDDFVINAVIPKVQESDPRGTFITPGTMPHKITWDDNVDEMHPYLHQVWRADYAAWADQHEVLIGDLQHWSFYPRSMDDRGAAQIVNEYGWLWLWRNGRPSPLGYDFYKYYLGGVEDVRANRELQAYNMQWETELFRVHQSVAAVMAFVYLTNDYGSTGDWFVGDIKDLTPGPTLQWFRHCFAPTAVFIDLVDQRYNKNLQSHAPGTILAFNLIGVNDRAADVEGAVEISVLDAKGQRAVTQTMPVTIPAFGRKPFPAALALPKAPGGYVVVAAFTPAGSTSSVRSRRYLKVGNAPSYPFFELQPEG